MIKIAVVLEKCEEGGFAASVPTLPGCYSQGDTVEEAMENIAEAIELRLEPVEDDLIVDDEAIVKELGLEIVPLHQGAVVPSPSAEGPRNGSDRPSTTADPLVGQAIGL